MSAIDGNHGVGCLAEAECSRPWRPVPEKTPTAATRRVHDTRRHPRLARELATLSAMIKIHCRELHGADETLCENCAALLVYATRRLDRCVFGRRQADLRELHGALL